MALDLDGATTYRTLPGAQSPPSARSSVHISPEKEHSTNITATDARSSKRASVRSSKRFSRLSDPLSTIEERMNEQLPADGPDASPPLSPPGRALSPSLGFGARYDDDIKEKASICSAERRRELLCHYFDPEALTPKERIVHTWFNRWRMLIWILLTLFVVAMVVLMCIWDPVQWK